MAGEQAIAIEVARNHFPELHRALDEELQNWAGEEIPDHVVIGMVVNPHLTALLSDGDPVKRDRALAFVEDLAASTDPAARNVAGATVVPYLWSGLSHGHRAAALASAGIATRAIVDHLGDRTSRDSRSRSGGL